MNTPQQPRGGILDRHPLEVRERAFNLYRKLGADGKRKHTLSQIAEAVGVPVGTINKWSSVSKWHARARALNKQDAVLSEYNQRPETEAANAPKTPRIDASTLTFEEKQETFSKLMADQALRLPQLMAKLKDSELLGAADKLAKLGAEARKALKLEEAQPSIILNVGLLARPALPAPVRAEIVSETPASSAPLLVEQTGTKPADAS
jgi:hypothetical protein